MMDSDAALYPVTFTLTKKPTLKQRLEEARPILIFFMSCFLFGLLLPPLSLLLGSPIWHATAANGIFYLFAMFFFGAVVGISAVIGVRTVSRRMLGRNQKNIEALEDRLRSGGSQDLITDLDQLISAHLKAGRASVAEHYSRQLLLLADREHSAEPLKPEIMLSTGCWVSTPAYHKSFNYSVIWLFQSRGLLCLTDRHMEYESSRLSFRTDLKDVVDISLAKHPWWLKPYPLKYIQITFREREYDTQYTMNLTPYMMQTDTVFDINKKVDEWYKILTQALAKASCD